MYRYNVQYIYTKTNVLVLHDIRTSLLQTSIICSISALHEKCIHFGCGTTFVNYSMTKVLRQTA